MPTATIGSPQTIALGAADALIVSCSAVDAVASVAGSTGFIGAPYELGRVVGEQGKRFGPYGRAVSLIVTSLSGSITAEVSQPSRSPDAGDALSASQAAATQALVSVAGNQNTCVTMGHSRIANGFSGTPVGLYTYQTYMIPLNFMLRKRLNFTANLAVTSATIQDVIANQLPVLLAMNPPPRYVAMEIGYNNWGTSLTAAEFIALYTGLMNSILATGATLLAFTDIGGTTLSAQSQIKQQVCNDWLVGRQGLTPRMYVIDGASQVAGTTADSSLGSMHSTMRQSDGIHENANGSYAIAREAFRVLNSEISPVPLRSGASGPFSQLVHNPTMDGDNTSGSGGWTAGTGNTGSGPSNSTGGRTGTASAVFSMVNRISAIVPSSRPGKVLQAAFTGGSALDQVSFSPNGSQNIRIANWSFTGLPLNYRIRPTVPNGCHYLVTTAGTTANVADPTGGWSTTIGATVTDGSVTYTVVPAIDVGDTVQLAFECLGGSLVGALVLQAKMQFYTLASALIATYTGGFTQSGVDTSAFLPDQQTVYTPPAVIPATTGIITCNLNIIGAAGATATVQIDNCELRKIG